MTVMLWRYYSISHTICLHYSSSEPCIQAFMPVPHFASWDRALETDHSLSVAYTITCLCFHYWNIFHQNLCNERIVFSRQSFSEAAVAPRARPLECLVWKLQRCALPLSLQGIWPLTCVVLIPSCSRWGKKKILLQGTLSLSDALSRIKAL